MTFDPERALRVEQLLGCPVRDVSGARVGRIEEIRAERNGDTYEVVEYHLGTGAMLERLGLVSRLLGRKPTTYIVKWEDMDLTAPGEPRLTRDIREIERKRS